MGGGKRRQVWRLERTKARVEVEQGTGRGDRMLE